MGEAVQGLTGGFQARSCDESEMLAKWKQFDSNGSHSLDRIELRKFCEWMFSKLHPDDTPLTPDEVSRGTLTSEPLSSAVGRWKLRPRIYSRNSMLTKVERLNGTSGPGGG